MTRRPRRDEPGSWHHVTNRAIARRSLFETEHDTRMFLAGVAHAVHRGELEIHAYAILTTHFHLLVRSPIGRLDHAMHGIQNFYVRDFNRGRKRDGPLLRNRYFSSAVTDDTYRQLLIAYIDLNPVKANLTSTPEAYPFGSAFHYVNSDGPIWLARDYVEEVVCMRTKSESYAPALYPQAFGRGIASTSWDLVSWRLELRQTATGPDVLHDLIHAAPPRVMQWLRRKSDLADGTRPGLPVATPPAVRATIASYSHEPWSLKASRKSTCAWQTIEVGILRDLTAAPYKTIAAITNKSRTTVARLEKLYRHHISNDAAFRQQAAQLTAEIIRPLAANPTHTVPGTDCTGFGTEEHPAIEITPSTGRRASR